MCSYYMLGIRSVVLKNLYIHPLILELDVGFTDEEAKENKYITINKITMLFSFKKLICGRTGKRPGLWIRKKENKEKSYL